jgi:hypothetical protein
MISNQNFTSFLRAVRISSADPPSLKAHRHFAPSMYMALMHITLQIIPTPAAAAVWLCNLCE